MGFMKKKPPSFLTLFPTRETKKQKKKKLKTTKKTTIIRQKKYENEKRVGRIEFKYVKKSPFSTRLWKGKNPVVKKPK